MYLYPWKLLSWRSRQSYREPFGPNGRYKNFFPFIQRYNFISHRGEHSRRKAKNDTNESSFGRLQVQNFFIFL
jgi:hypothetical protein